MRGTDTHPTTGFTSFVFWCFPYLHPIVSGCYVNLSLLAECTAEGWSDVPNERCHWRPWWQRFSSRGHQRALGSPTPGEAPREMLDECLKLPANIHEHRMQIIIYSTCYSWKSLACCHCRWQQDKKAGKGLGDKVRLEDPQIHQICLQLLRYSQHTSAQNHGRHRWDAGADVETGGAPGPWV